MGRRQQRFEPEIYLQKAEDDIRSVQTLCSLAEPSWDGYCGLVLLNEDNTAQAYDDVEPKATDASEGVGSSDQQQHHLQGDSVEQQHWQDQSLQKITQQIKSISSVPQAQRKRMLGSLIQEASTAAEHCDVNTRDQLLELAAFARKARAKEPAGWETDKPTDNAGLQTAAKWERKPSIDALTQASVEEEEERSKNSEERALAANQLFKAAIDSVKRNKLAEAIKQLEDAFLLCPEEKAVARSKIRKYAAVVTAEMQKK